jgi:ABC-2 type transport system permease protein
MRNIFTIAKRELLSFFVSPLAYFIITGFLVLAGYFFSVLLLIFLQYSQQIAAQPFAQGPTPNLNEWVVERLYGTLLVILVFLVPVLTMRTIAEEKKRGTFELLLTSPVSVSELVWGKFLGIGVVIAVMIGSVFSFPILLLIFSQPKPEFMPMLAGLVGVFVCGLAFASISMAISSFSESQVVAGVTSMVVLLLLYVIHSPAQSVGGVAGSVLEYISPVLQVKDFIKGVISLKSCIYFISLIGLGIFLSQRVLEAERWR